MGVGIENPLLTRKGGGDAMNTMVVGPGLVHAAVGAGGTDWTRLPSILCGVCGIGGVLLVPGHGDRAWVSSNQMHVVVERGNNIACDQQGSPRPKSAGFLNVDTVLDGTTNDFVTRARKITELRKDGVQAEHAEVGVSEHSSVADTGVASFAELREGHKGLGTHAVDDDGVKS